MSPQTPHSSRKLAATNSTIQRPTRLTKDTLSMFSQQDIKSKIGSHASGAGSLRPDNISVKTGLISQRSIHKDQDSLFHRFPSIQPQDDKLKNFLSLGDILTQRSKMAKLKALASKDVAQFSKLNFTQNIDNFEASLSPKSLK